MTTIAAEARKLPAFVRRDFLVAWSYRTAFVSDVVGLVAMVLLFYFIGLMVDADKLPTYGGRDVTYMEFAAVGMTLGLLLQFGIGRVSAALRNEQLIGTLESLLMTPTAPTTIQIGSVMFDLLYLPLRAGLFLGAIALAFGLRLDPGGILPALVLLAAFLPFVWGLGVFGAALVLTFRRGGGAVTIAIMALALLSGAYFPLELLPTWAGWAATLNPIAIAIEGSRDALLGGTDWAGVPQAIAILIPVGAAALVFGFTAFRLALARERRLGTVGHY